MDKSKVFVTVAMGNYYCYLAENLYKSYKLFKNNDLPFYVVTDSLGERHFNSRKLFDGIKTIEYPKYNFLDKLEIYNLLDFDEIIFIDADCFICGDIVFLFDLFEKNKSEVSCLGVWNDIGKRKGSYEYTNYFNNIAIEKFGLKKYIQLEGGLYYFRHSHIADEIMSFATQQLDPHYDEFGLNRQGGGQKSDECVFNVAMGVFGMNPLGNSDHKIMDYVYRVNMYGYNYKWHKIKWKPNIECFKVISCTEDNQKFKRDILIPHWTTVFSKTISYYYFSCLIDCKYKRYGKIKTTIIVFDKMLLHLLKKTTDKIKRRIATKNKNGNT